MVLLKAEDNFPSPERFLVPDEPFIYEICSELSERHVDLML